MEIHCSVWLFMKNLQSLGKSLKKIIPLIFFLIFFVLSTHLWAEESSAEEEEILLEESFIGLKINAGYGSGFFRVLIDEEENPYLDVQNLMDQWLALNVTCRVEDLYCEIIVYEDGNTYWVDGVNQQLGFKNELENSSEALPKNSLLVREGKLWLRYDVWDQWFPVECNWNMIQYKLSFLPKFSLLAQRKREREEIRKKQKQLIKIQTERNQWPVTGVKKGGGTELRYTLQHEEKMDTDNSRSQSVTWELNQDIWSGTLHIAGAISREEKESETKIGNQYSWDYSKSNNLGIIDLLKAGSVGMPGGLLVPGAAGTQGIYLQKGDANNAFEDLLIRGIVKPDTEIDVFHKRFIIASTVAGKDGTYSISDIHVPAGDVVSIHFYFSDGSEKVEKITIAPDNGQLPEPWQWDGLMYMGENNEQKMKQLGFLMGIFPNVALGMDTYQFDNLSSGQNNQLSLLKFSWRPLPGLYLYGEKNMDSDEGAINWKLTSFSPYIIQFYIKKFIPESFLSSLQEGQGLFEQILHQSHSFPLWGWAVKLDYTRFDTLQVLKLKGQKKLSRRWNLQHEINQSWDNDAAPISHKIGLDYLQGRHYLKTSSALNEEGSDTGFSYRYQGGENKNWDFSFKVSSIEKDNPSYALSLGWRPFSGISTRSVFLEDQSQHTLLTSWNGIFSTPDGAEEWGQFGGGNMVGRVLLNKGLDQEPEPIAGVAVEAGRTSVISDENGVFSLHGLPTDNKVFVAINEGSLEIGLNALQEGSFFRFRPGTTLQQDFFVVKGISVEGQLIYPGVVPMNVMVAAIRQKDNQKMAEIETEEDGFFMLENLPPDIYYLKVTGMETPPPPYLLDGTQGIDWIDGIRLE